MLTCLLGAVMAAGCTTPAGNHPSAQPASAERWNGARLLMLPFIDAAQVMGAETSVRNPFTKRVYLTGEPNPEAAALVTDLFLDELRRVAHVSVKLLKYPLPGWRKGRERIALLELARSYDADGILVGYLYLFKQRQGKQYSVVEPATVAFDVVLLDARNGQVAWKAAYNEKQRALSEDLLSLGDFVKRGGRWLTAEQLARDGIAKVLENFPGRRKQ